MERAMAALNESRRSGSNANTGFGQHRADLPALLALPRNGVEDDPRPVRRDGEQQPPESRISVRSETRYSRNGGSIDIRAEDRVDMSRLRFIPPLNCPASRARGVPGRIGSLDASSARPARDA